MELIVENNSNADSEYLKVFYDEINNLDEKIKRLINFHKFKIILVNKFTDLMPAEKVDETTSQYKENYRENNNRDELTRGVCNDTIGICVFYNTTTVDNLAAILYHEIAHLIDFHNSSNFEKPCLSTNEKFIDAYKKDLALHWDKIKKDTRFRLVHYIQDSTPDCPSGVALIETFAHCFARIHNKIDDIDIVELYFLNSKKAAKEIIEDFMLQYQNG